MHTHMQRVQGRTSLCRGGHTGQRSLSLGRLPETEEEKHGQKSRPEYLVFQKTLLNQG